MITANRDSENEYIGQYIVHMAEDIFIDSREQIWCRQSAQSKYEKAVLLRYYSEVYIFPNLYSRFRLRTLINDICRFYLTLVDQTFIMEIASYEMSL